MADKILEETNKDVTEGTQTEGTSTGNGYLTKPYLVRNLQTFWGKIKEYITNQKFVNQDTVNGAISNAVSGKADKTALEALTTTVSGKIDQSTLDTALATKVNVDGDKVLSDENFTIEEKQKLKV